MSERTGVQIPNLNPIVLLKGAKDYIHLGGTLLLFGIFTRPVAFIVSGEMAVAYFTAHLPRG